MAVKAVFFDVGGTLVDETAMWERAADAAGVPRFDLMGVLGGLAARGEHHARVWEVLGVEQPDATWERSDFFPDALPCIEELRSRGLLVGAAGNTPLETEELLRDHVDVVGSGIRWGAEKPARAFFERLVGESGVAPGEFAYVGDRVDNDVLPARAAGLAAVHVRRGPWGLLHETPAGVPSIRSLVELPGALGVGVRGV